MRRSSVSGEIRATDAAGTAAHATHLTEYHAPVIATAIFILLLATLLAMRLRRRWPSIVLFVVSLVCVVLLLAHHATDHLDLSF